MHQKQLVLKKEKNKFSQINAIYTLSELYFFHFPYLPLYLHVFLFFVNTNYFQIFL